MNWIKANKFLTGLLAVAVLGLGIFGYLIWDAMGKADAATEEFNKQAAEYKRLESLPTYPNQKNLQKLEEQRKEHQDRIDALQTKLASMEGPTEPMGPVPFQDRLRQSVSDFVKKAGQAGLELPAKEGEKGFYMGMARYQSAPPRPEAAPLLGRELKALEYIMDSLIEARVGKLTEDFNREEFPEENGTAPKATPPPRPGVRGATAPLDLVKKHAIGVKLYADQLPLQKFLNAIATAKNSFLVIRDVSISNEKTAGPSRDAGATAGAATPAAPATPDPSGNPAPAATPTEPAPTGIHYIVGQEKVNATVIIELTDFAPVAGNDQSGAKKKNGPPPAKPPATHPPGQKPGPPPPPPPPKPSDSPAQPAPTNP